MKKKEVTEIQNYTIQNNASSGGDLKPEKNKLRSKRDKSKVTKTS